MDRSWAAHKESTAPSLRENWWAKKKTHENHKLILNDTHSLKCCLCAFFPDPECSSSCSSSDLPPVLAPPNHVPRPDHLPSKASISSLDCGRGSPALRALSSLPQCPTPGTGAQLATAIMEARDPGICLGTFAM